MRADESLDDMTPLRREALAVAIASQAGLERSSVIRLDIAAASIVVNATLRAPSASEAATAASQLSTALSTAALASQLLNLSVTTAVEVDVRSVRALVPAPLPPHSPPPPTNVATSGGGSGGSGGAYDPAACGAGGQH